MADNKTYTEKELLILLLDLLKVEKRRVRFSDAAFLKLIESISETEFGRQHLAYLPAVKAEIEAIVQRRKPDVASLQAVSNFKAGLLVLEGRATYF